MLVGAMQALPYESKIFMLRESENARVYKVSWYHLVFELNSSKMTSKNVVHVLRFQPGDMTY